MTTTLATRDNLEAMLRGMEAEFGKVLQDEIPPAAFCRVALSCVSKNPKLLQCTPQSFFGALMDLAELSLTPGSVLGHAYLVPFKTTCQVVIGYRGLLDLVRRSAKVSRISAKVVYPEDEFSVTLGTEPRIHHNPGYPDLDDDDRITHVYACAWMHGSTQPEFEVMTRAQVERIRLAARSRDSEPWRQYWAEMAKKTVLRRLCKLLPLSGKRYEQVLEQDNADYYSPKERTLDLQSVLATDLLPPEGPNDEPKAEEGTTE